MNSVSLDFNDDMSDKLLSQALVILELRVTSAVEAGSVSFSDNDDRFV